MYFRLLGIPFVPEAGVSVTYQASTDRSGGVHDTDLASDENTAPGVWWSLATEAGLLLCFETVAVQPGGSENGPALWVQASVPADRACTERFTLSVGPEGVPRRRGNGPNASRSHRARSDECRAHCETVRPCSLVAVRTRQTELAGRVRAHAPSPRVPRPGCSSGGTCR